MPHPYAAIRAKALHIATRQNISREYRRDLRHIALDCEWAAEGCANSAASVAEWLDHDGLLSSELDYVPTASESTSTVGMVA